MQNKIKVAVLVSGGGTNLQAILDAEKSGIISNAKVDLVISNNPNAYALKRAENFGIKAVVVNKKQLGASLFEKEVSKLIEKNDIDIIVLAGFMCILSESFTSKYPKRILNVHPALIPSFCGKGYYGLKVHQAALDYGVKVTGATVHFVNEIPDGGAIIMQKAVEIKENDTAEILQKRVMEQAEWKILPAAIEEVSKKILLKRGLINEC